MSEIIILNAGDVEFYVQTLKPSIIENIGSKAWFDEHQRLERLRQQCIVEATNNVEERVKEVLITYGKLAVLVNEVICIQLWRQKVWKKILKVTEKKLSYGFIGYMILYHECTAVNFLQILLHHQDAVQSLKEESLDLIDYCAFQIIITSSEKSKREEIQDDPMCELRDQQEEMALNTGLASIAILASLSEFLDDLSVSAVVRLYDTHDVPVLMANLIEVQPWKRRSTKDNSLEYYNEGQWTAWDPEELCKCEAQCWIALRGLLLHPAAKQHYELTEFRKQALLKLQRHLHEAIIDQLSPLIELRQYLGHLSVLSQPRVNKSPLILETVAPIRESLVSQGSKWKKLAQDHIAMMFDGELVENVMEIAKSVSETYDADMMATLEVTPQPRELCQGCGKVAKKRCSQCQGAWYCTRQCQVKHWSTHKLNCVTTK